KRIRSSAKGWLELAHQPTFHQICTLPSLHRGLTVNIGGYHRQDSCLSASCLLQPRPPFRFELALAYLSRSPLEVLDVVQNGAYRRAVRLGGRPRLLEVRAIG